MKYDFSVFPKTTLQTQYTIFIIHTYIVYNTIYTLYYIGFPPLVLPRAWLSHKKIFSNIVVLATLNSHLFMTYTLSNHDSDKLFSFSNVSSTKPYSTRAQ